MERGRGDEDNRRGEFLRCGEILKLSLSQNDKFLEWCIEGRKNKEEGIWTLAEKEGKRK